MFHPMTGKKTKLVIHYNIGPAALVTTEYVELTTCGRYVHESMNNISTWDMQQVTCMKCLEQLTKPYSDYFQ